MIIDDIIKARKEQLEHEISKVSREQIKEEAEAIETGVRDFFRALYSQNIAGTNNKHLAVIAEVKRSSPSKGILRENFKPVEIATEYEKAGANAISVLTEEKFFGGSSRYLRKIRKVTKLPVLRKDFIFDEYQVYESRILGADAILLIASVLSDEELYELSDIAFNLNMNVLFEIHSADEIEKVMKCYPRMIGINNRNLKTMEVDIKNTEEIVEQIPPECLLISESGILTNDDMKRVHKAGVNAVLIGESLIKSENITRKLNELRIGV
ncbi:MAG: indole-3-glycerol phosphate synthase TrpC [Ruminococcus sp.]|jgi:indole-3-glycerol phosphate synthase|nr:indole-3-glycerol phosphate synthase TrpC [Ruminococcus sp.]